MCAALAPVVGAAQRQVGGARRRTVTQTGTHTVVRLTKGQGRGAATWRGAEKAAQAALGVAATTPLWRETPTPTPRPTLASQTQSQTGVVAGAQVRPHVTTLWLRLGLGLRRRGVDEQLQVAVHGAPAVGGSRCPMARRAYRSTKAEPRRLPRRQQHVGCHRRAKESRCLNCRCCCRWGTPPPTNVCGGLNAGWHLLEQTLLATEQTLQMLEQTPLAPKQMLLAPLALELGQTPLELEQTPLVPEQTPLRPEGMLEQTPPGPEQTPLGPEQTPLGPEQTL